MTVAPEAAASEVAPTEASEASREGEPAPPERAGAGSDDGEVAPQERTGTGSEDGEVAPSSGAESTVQPGAPLEDTEASREGETAPQTREPSPEAERGDGVVATPPAPPRDAAAPSSREGELAASSRPRAPLMPAEREESRLTRYLQRPVRYGVHFLDHGVLQPAVAGGWPHGYRLELSLGLLDHLTLGVTAHWLPGQSRPHVAPVIAIAIMRGRYYEFGVRHFWSLFPPPRADLDPTTPSYQRSAQWTLATASFGQAWLTGGLDAGAVRARVDDPAQDPGVDTSNPSTIRWRFGGGLHLRAGTRRWGFTAQVLVPHPTAELRFDVRFGLFEKRSKGGWKPYGMAEDWDRGAPW
jgi:hypothetical protein